ncbi:carboxypeptidase-like regulatory domain-containing protein [Flavobacterium sp.]|uniref:carboxypeptidase-like regulatory domain-containing protein n=1 Tax=Flavobacterium sp. TaxID=239 RepID=UPI003529C0CA
MKQFIILFLSVLTIQAQTSFSGHIIDKQTQERLPFINVFSPETNQGVYTNNDGYFEFQIPQSSKTIVISCLGYKSIILNVSQVTQNMKFELETENYLLDELIIVNKPLNEIVEKLVQNSQQQLERSIKLETYYREFVKINNQYSKFADGLVDYYLKPKRKDKVKAKVVVNQSRAFELIKEHEVEAKGSASSSLNSLYNFKDAANSFFSFDAIENYLSDAKSSNDYDFEITRKITEDGKEIETIQIKALPEVEKVLVEGYITYDAKRNLILEYHLKLSETHKKYSKLKNMILFKAKINDFDLKTSFKYLDEKYVPNYKKFSFDVYLKFGKMVNDNLSGTADVLINHYQDENVVLPQKEQFYTAHSLYENGMNYTTEFWKTNKAMQLSAKEESILKQIQND